MLLAGHLDSRITLFVVRSNATPITQGLLSSGLNLRHRGRGLWLGLGLVGPAVAVCRSRPPRLSRSCRRGLAHLPVAELVDQVGMLMTFFWRMTSHSCRRLRLANMALQPSTQTPLSLKLGTPFPSLGSNKSAPSLTPKWQLNRTIVEHLYAQEPAASGEKMSTSEDCVRTQSEKKR